MDYLVMIFTGYDMNMQCNKNISCGPFFLGACVPGFSAFIPTVEKFYILFMSYFCENKFIIYILLKKTK